MFEQDKSASGARDSREWQLIEKLLTGAEREQRKSRRWGLFFKCLTFLYLFGLFFAFQGGGKGAPSESDSHTAVIEVNGIIAADADASADAIVTSLREAFEAPTSKAVILRINSPGGSPVQAGYVYDEIKRLRSEYPDKKLYAVISDLGASGAYYIAAAADEIYADKASLVGSIGVIASGFGFVDTLEKLGVERRLYTAGEHKGFLDPFSPSNPAETAFWQTVLDTTHKQFIEQVRLGRGDRLKETPETFSGLVWTGEQAKALGLVDGLGSTSYVAREIVGEENVVDYTFTPDPIEQLVKKMGVAVGQSIGREVLSGASLQLR